MSSPELLQVVRLHLCYTHVRHAWALVSCRWFHIKRRWCHIIGGDLVWRGHCFVYSFYGVRKSPGEKKHARTGYFSYHLTMKEHGGCNFDTNHHDFTSVVAFMFVWGLLRCRQVVVGSLQPSVMTSDGSWPTLSYCWGPTMRLRSKHRCSDALFVSSCEQLSQELENTNLLKGIKKKPDGLCSHLEPAWWWWSQGFPGSPRSPSGRSYCSWSAGGCARVTVKGYFSLKISKNLSWSNVSWLSAVDLLGCIKASKK